MSANTHEVMAQIKAWLLARRPEIQDIAPDFDIIENRVIDSLSFTEFIIFLEEVSGQDVEIDAGSVNTFRTLRAIQENVVEKASA
jgi:acyl carrier protein